MADIRTNNMDPGIQRPATMNAAPGPRGTSSAYSVPEPQGVARRQAPGRPAQQPGAQPYSNQGQYKVPKPAANGHYNQRDTEQQNQYNKRNTAGQNQYNPRNTAGQNQYNPRDSAGYYDNAGRQDNYNAEVPRQEQQYSAPQPRSSVPPQQYSNDHRTPAQSQYNAPQYNKQDSQPSGYANTPLPSNNRDSARPVSQTSNTNGDILNGYNNRSSSSNLSLGSDRSSMALNPGDEEEPKTMMGKALSFMDHEYTMMQSFPASLNTWTSFWILPFSIVFFVTAFSTVGWAEVDSEINSGSPVHRQFGLWQMCHNISGCRAISSRDVGDSSGYRAAQTFAVFSLLALFGAMIAFACYVFFPGLHKTTKAGYAALGSRFATVICLLLTFAIYADNWYKPAYVGTAYSRRLEYSHALCIVTWVLEIVALICIALEVYNKQHEQLHITSLKQLEELARQQASDEDKRRHSNMSNTAGGWGEMPDKSPQGQGWGEMPDKPQSQGQGWGEMPDKPQSQGKGWGEMPDRSQPKGQGQGWGELPDRQSQNRGEVPDRSSVPQGQRTQSGQGWNDVPNGGHQQQQYMEPVHTDASPQNQPAKAPKILGRRSMKKSAAPTQPTQSYNMPKPVRPNNLPTQGYQNESMNTSYESLSGNRRSHQLPNNGYSSLEI